MPSNREVVTAFLTSLEKADVQQALSLLTDDVVWENTGLPTLRGDTVHAALRGMERRGVGFGVEMNHIAESDDGVVLTDRFDVLTWKKLRSRIWVCGTFTLVDGRISVWFDHYSNTNLVKGLFVGTAGALRGR